MNLHAESTDAEGGRIRRRNRALILQAAEKVFAAKGFNGATTAEIAARAGLPKANLHYYFPSKEAVYRTVIAETLRLWLSLFDHIAPDDDPATALAAYIRRKMRHSFEHPLASRIFALEVIRGAPVIRDFLAGDLRAGVEEKGRVIRAWAGQGRMAAVEPVHLFLRSGPRPRLMPISTLRSRPCSAASRRPGTGNWRRSSWWACCSVGAACGRETPAQAAGSTGDFGQPSQACCLSG